MYIPIFLKNAGLALFKVELYKALITLIPSSLSFSIIRIIIGNRIRNINELMETK